MDENISRRAIHYLSIEANTITGESSKNSSSQILHDNKRFNSPKRQNQGKKKLKKTSDSYKDHIHRDILDTIRACKLFKEKKTVFISIDLEAFEMGKNVITELGIAIYDSRHQQHAIFPDIRSYHFIIEENIKHMNGKYVPDNKHNFLNGPSIIVSSSKLKYIFQDILNAYRPSSNNDTNRKTEIAFVGHDFKGDIQLLRILDIEIPTDVPIVDTLKVWKSISKKGKSNLDYVLRVLGIPHSFLHNAGNDAYYTLTAAMQLCDPELKYAKGFLDQIRRPFLRMIMADGSKKGLWNPQLPENNFFPGVSGLTEEQIFDILVDPYTTSESLKDLLAEKEVELEKRRKEHAEKREKQKHKQKQKDESKESPVDEQK